MSKNLSASVRQRLLQLARDRQEDFQMVLSRFTLERLVYRLSHSVHHDRFVVKGAMLFQIWTSQIYRPTRDIDFLAHGEHSVTHLENLFREVCGQNVEDDGLVFEAGTVRGRVIKADQEYEGVRIQLEARLERARIPVQIDIGFGDAITPAPQQATYPSMLGFPTPVVSIYPRETVIAEKFQAMVVLGIANSRMKDFFDVWLLAITFEFAGPLLINALGATFQRRRTSFSEAIPTALTEEFYGDAAKQKQWKAFIFKSGLIAPSLPELIAVLRAFLLPPSEALLTGRLFSQHWLPRGPWR